ncbi:2-oxo acid dehydrogenase subunit E2 [Halotia wernerae UHCC 0503]|nr:2-oxo acid dehydrogenase subunit E2 [Halotia wernerae UHCC 0503]
MDDIGTYEERRFPEFRTPTLDTLDFGQAKHHIPLLLEVDITKAREYIREFKARTGEGLSFTGYVIKCIGQAVSEHKYIHAMRRGKKRLVLFDDVDISLVVERSVGHSDNLETLPTPYVIRKANQKTVKEIHTEIRTVQKQLLTAGEVQLGAHRNANLTKIFNLMPRFIRNLLVWQRLAKDPFFAKKAMGTVAVTSMGSAAKSRYSCYGWGIPIGIHPLVFALGSIARKPGVVGDAIAIREYLSMTILFDHDVTDGAPAFRFTQRLIKLIEDGYGLTE